MDEFRERHPESVVVPINIDAVGELTLQDRDMAYCEIWSILRHKLNQHAFNIVFYCQKDLF